MITDVKLPKEIGSRLEHETTFQSKNREQKRKQEFGLLKTLHMSEVEQKRQQYKNEQLAFQEEAKKQLYLIKNQVEEVEARTAKQMAELNAEAKRTAATILEQAKRVAANNQAKKEAALLEMRTKAQAKRDELLADQNAYSQDVLSRAELVVAENRAKTLKIVGDQEANAAKKIKEKRKNDLNVSRLALLDALSKNENAVIASKTNGNIVAQVAASELQQSLYAL